MSEPQGHTTITSLTGIQFGANNKFTTNSILNSDDKVITFPSDAATLASVASVSAVDSKADGIDTRVKAIETAQSSVVTLNGEQTLTNKTLTAPIIASIVNGGKTINMPSSAGTLALASDVSDASSSISSLSSRFDKLLDYLESWISVGNLSMSDIKDSVNN